MEFDEIVVKESPGLCRCCLSEGCYKDLGSEYTWMSENEVYADMLLECFDISITQHNEGPNGSSRLICEVCITRLRDACNFKKQVLESEKKFVDMVAKGEFRPKVLVYQAQMKAEEEPAESQEEIVEYLDDNIDYEDDEPLKRDATLPAQETDNNITVELLPIKGKRGRPRKSTDVKAVKAAKKVKIDDEKPKTSKAVAKGASREYHSRTAPIQENDLADTKKLKALKILLHYTTVTPFRRHGNRHKCFFCEKCFKLVTKLREHTQEKHSNDQNFDESITETTVNVDITDLKCKICFLLLDSLEDMMDHLNKKHDENLTEIPNAVCFKLTDENFACIYCHKKFKIFGSLLLHIDSDHLDKKNLCKVCGIEFSAKVDLFKHTRSVHSIGDYDCAYCDRKFLNQRRRDGHVKSCCKGKRSCLLCSEVFSTKKERDQHMYKDHSHTMPWYKCDRCPIKFKLKRLLNDHYKRVHLKEKNVTCEVCGMTFFSNGLLNLHKVRHSDSKPFECGTCGKKFPRKSAMELHVRIHTNERRYTCKVCGKSFIQWTSLKYHLPQHSEERNFKCVVCEKAFKTKPTMLKHCVNVHGKRKAVDSSK